MDIQILRAIVQSRSEVMKDVEDPEAFDRSLTEDKFPLTEPAVLNALTKSFTNLISYKVSPEAYQRYAVRIQVIEILREWLRPPKVLNNSRTFCQSERILEFTAKILRIYLKNEISFPDDDNTDVLVRLARALMCLLPNNKTYVADLELVLERIARTRPTEAGQRLLLTAVKRKDDLGLGSSTVERLYVCQSAKLIEDPLIDAFVDNVRDSNDRPVLPNDFKSSSALEELIKFVAESPTIFQIASSVLKEIFIRSNYSSQVLDYIKFFLSSVRSCCRQNNKNVLDLYPIRLQSCVLLLDVEPERHSSNSRDYVLKYLERINSTNPDETVVLMSHYPNWLQSLSSYLGRSRNVIDTSVDGQL